MWELPKIRNLGVPTIRILLVLSTILGSPIFGNSHIGSINLLYMGGHKSFFAILVCF